MEFVQIIKSIKSSLVQFKKKHATHHSGVLQLIFVCPHSWVIGEKGEGSVVVLRILFFCSWNRQSGCFFLFFFKRQCTNCAWRPIEWVKKLMLWRLQRPPLRQQQQHWIREAIDVTTAGCCLAKEYESGGIGVAYGLPD